jgi:hypothetical protein
MEIPEFPIFKDLVQLAADFGPFLFAILFIMVVTRTAHGYYRECSTRTEPLASPEECQCVKGGLKRDQNNLSKLGLSGRASFCESAGEGRLALRNGTMCLGPPSCGRGADLCHYVGTAGFS